MDTLLGYNQVPSDEVHPLFVTTFGTYWYKVMSFGLKNVGTTYQRLMTTVFKPQLDRNMEVYVDDMIVKSKETNEHMQDSQEMFDRLRYYNMYLNPQKPFSFPC